MRLNKKGNYTVYIHISPSCKYYVGITRQRVSKRWRNGNGYKKNKHFYNAIKKYGWDNFEHEIIADNLTMEEACKFEITLIKELNSNHNSYGYNNSNGGDGVVGYVVSDEIKSKISMSRIGGLNSKAKEVICDGILYGSISEFSRAMDLKSQNVGSWLRKTNKMPKEWYDRGLRYPDENMDAYEWYGSTPNYTNANEPIKKKVISHHKNSDKPIRKKGSTTNKKVVCNGITYNSIKECADSHNVNHETMRTWVSGVRDMPIEFYNMGLRLYEKEMCDYIVLTKKTGSQVKCDGITYNSIKECSKCINVNYSTLKAWLSKNRREEIPKEYKERGLMLV